MDSLSHDFLSADSKSAESDSGPGASKIEVDAAEQPRNQLHQALLDLGYMAPTWDDFQLHHTFHTINPSESAILTTELTPIEQFLVKVWPRIENFFSEDEDLTVMLNGETVLKNGNLTRVFKFCYLPNNNSTKTKDDENMLWEFVLEKQILPGFKWNNNNRDFVGNLRQKWAHISPGKKIQEVTERKIFTRSFDSQSHCTKFKLNRSSAKVLDGLQKEFLNDLRKYVVEGFRDEVSGVGLVQEAVSSEAEELAIYFRGKEIQFEEGGNQIIWSMAQRKIPANSNLGNKMWFVNASRKRETPKSSKPEDQLRIKHSHSNPFEIEDVLGGEPPNGSEQQEYIRQVAERSIQDFINGVWPSVRNLFLEVAPNTKLPLTVAQRNKSLTKTLELHFDSLDERNRWKCLLEISTVGHNNTVESKSDPDSASSSACSNDSASEVTDLRSYKSFERRGTTSSNGKDANEYFNGLYKRWFLNELQMALVHCYAHIDYNAMTLERMTFEPQAYQIGKDLEFLNSGHETVWSFSIQKIPQYCIEDTPKHVWTYQLANVSHLSGSEGCNVLRAESQESILAQPEASARQRQKTAPPTGRASKSRSSIKNMVAKTFRPVMEKLGRKSVVVTPISGRLKEEDNVSKSTLNASAYMADAEGESNWSRGSTNQLNF